MLLLEGEATSVANIEKFTRDPFKFLYDKLPGGGHIVTMCYMSDGSEHVGGYGPRSRKYFTPELDSIIKREMNNVDSMELSNVLEELVNSRKYNDAIANNVPGAPKKLLTPLDLHGGRICIVQKIQFNWVSKPTFAKRLERTRDGEHKIFSIMRARENNLFGAPKAAYQEDDWRNKYDGTKVYPEMTKGDRNYQPYTDSHRGAAYTRPASAISSLNRDDLPYVIDGKIVIDEDGETMFGTTVEFTKYGEIKVDMDTYNNIANMWPKSEVERFGWAEDNDRMYKIPNIIDARYDSNGDYDDTVMIRQSYDTTNKSYRVIDRKWYYIESDGYFVEISDELGNALAAKTDRAEDISAEEKAFLDEIKEIQTGSFNNEQLSVDKLLFMNCDGYQYIGDYAVARYLDVDVECVQRAIESMGSHPDFNFEEALDARRREDYAKSLGYDTELPKLHEAVHEFPNTNIDLAKFNELIDRLQGFVKRNMDNGNMEKYIRFNLSGTDTVYIHLEDFFNMSAETFVAKYYRNGIEFIINPTMAQIMKRNLTECENAVDHRRMIAEIDGNHQDNNTYVSLFNMDIHGRKGMWYLRIDHLIERPDKISAFYNWMDRVERELNGSNGANESAIIRSEVKKYLNNL